MSGTEDTFAEGEGGRAAPDGVAGQDDAARRAGQGDPGEGNARERREQRRYGEMARRAAEAEERVRSLTARLAEAEEAGSRSRMAALERDLDAATAQAARSFADGDPEAHVKALRSVAEIAASRAVAAQPAARPAAAAEGQATQPRFTPTTQAWMDENPWFGSDDAATKLARKAHGSAVAAGMAPDSPEYWSFIRDKVNAVRPGLVREPDGFADPAPARKAREDESGDDGGEGDGASAAAAPARPPAGGAAPVTRPPANTSRPGGEFRLSADQVEAAKIAGVTPQAYAAALRAGQKSGQFVPAARRSA